MLKKAMLGPRPGSDARSKRVVLTNRQLDLLDSALQQEIDFCTAPGERRAEEFEELRRMLAWHRSRP